MLDARPSHDVNGSGDLGKFNVIVTFDEGDFIGTLFEDISEFRAQRIPRVGSWLIITLPSALTTTTIVSFVSGSCF